MERCCERTGSTARDADRPVLSRSDWAYLSTSEDVTFFTLTDRVVPFTARSKHLPDLPPSPPSRHLTNPTNHVPYEPTSNGSWFGKARVVIDSCGLAAANSFNSLRTNSLHM